MSCEVAPLPRWHHSTQSDASLLASCLQLWMVNSERPIIHHKRLEGCHCPTGGRLGQSPYARIADLVASEEKHLHMVCMAHETKLRGLENACAKSQGVGARQ